MGVVLPAEEVEEVAFTANALAGMGRDAPEALSEESLAAFSISIAGERNRRSFGVTHTKGMMVRVSSREMSQLKLKRRY